LKQGGLPPPSRVRGDASLAAPPLGVEMRLERPEGFFSDEFLPRQHRWIFMLLSASFPAAIGDRSATASRGSR
jgi:hypothetical protein